MSGDGIFLIHADGRLEELIAEPYASEDEFQRLVADHPAVLPGAQISPAAPRRWMLVDREVGVPATEAGGNQWSLDHLFIDQDAVPTIVELKRASDTRLRREVVGQMLDYAANGVRYWPVHELQDRWREEAARRNRDPVEVLRELTESDVDPDEFWQRVEANLRAGRVRMLFVADRIPAELQRIVEFLNEQMRPAEVLAVELRHYRRDATRTLIPRVMGATAMARQTKSSGDTRSFDEIIAAGPPEGQEVERLLREWATRHGLQVTNTAKALQVKDVDGKTLVQMYADQGWVEIPLGVLDDAGATGDVEAIGAAMDELAHRPLKRRAPGLPAVEVAPVWANFEVRVLDPYLNARRNVS